MAGSFGGANDDDMISGINVTPLVDVVLVLLVIFLMTAPVIYQSAIKVQLPKAKSGEQASDKAPLNFTVTQDGQVMWGKDPVDWDTLSKKLVAFGEKISEETAVISADEKTSHGAVIKLMDTLRQAGLSRFALSVEAPPK